MRLPSYLLIGILLLKPISLWRPRWSCWASYILSRKSCKNGDAKEPTTDSPSHLSLNLLEKRQKTKFQEYVILLRAQGQASHQIGRAMNFPQEKKMKKKKKKAWPKAIHSSSSLWCYMWASAVHTCISFTRPLTCAHRWQVPPDEQTPSTASACGTVSCSSSFNPLCSRPSQGSDRG